MATDMFGNELDENGNPKKKAVTSPTLPLQDPNNPSATVKLSPEAMSGAAASPGVTAGNTAVLAKAQNDVLQQPQTSPLQDATTQAATNWVQNPMGDFNPQKNKQQRLEKSNADWANTFENMRQQYGNVSGSGLLQQNMLQNALAHNVDQAALESNIDQENYNRYVDSLGKSIGAAQSVNQGNENIFSQRLNNLGTVRGMAEGERAQSQGFQENVALTKMGFDNATQMAALNNGYDLQKLNAAFGNDMAKMVATQNWTAGQAQLDREAAIAAQSTDINAKQAFQDKQNAFDMAKLNATQDWQSQQNKIENELKLSMQANDINATSANIQKQLDLDKWKQENGQTFTAEQNAMNRTLETSLKNLDIKGQSDLMNLKAAIDSKTLLTSQDFEAAQKSLDRAAAVAAQNNDIKAQQDIINQKAKLDEAAQSKQNEFNNSQRIATQTWQTGETVRAEDAQKAAQYFDWQQKNLAQTNDLEGQKALATLKNSFDLNMQTNAMSHDEKMAYLENQYNEAKAANDVNRQKDILGFTYNQDISKMAEASNFDTVKMQVQGNIQAALNAGDYEHADAMQDALFTQQAKEHDKDLAEEGLKRKLQEKGMNYDVMMNAIETGAATPEDFNTILKAAGIDVSPIDPLASQKATKQKLDDMKYEFALTHPEMTDPKQIRDEFNAFVNKANGTSADASTKIGDIIQSPANYAGSADPGSPKHGDYLMLKNNAATFEPAYDKKGDLYQFKNAPAQNTAIMYGGNLVVVSGPVQVEKTSWAPNNQYFYATDVNTGKQIKIYANKNPAAPYSGLAPGLGIAGAMLGPLKTSTNAIKKWLGF
jgi:hypothetical protein